MFLLYVDASGAPELEGDRPLYATVGICVHEGTWFALERRIAGLKRRYQISDAELHAKDFCTTISEQSEIADFENLDGPARRTAVLRLREQKLIQSSGKKREIRKKKYRATDAYVHLDRRTRTELLGNALNLVGSHDGIRLFGEVADKQYLFETSGERNAVRNNFTQLLSRFDAFLTRYNQDQSTIDNGILVMDNEPTYETQFAHLLDQYRERGHPWGPVNHVVETPFFVDSKTSSAIQMADLCCYVVRRYIEKAGIEGTPEEENFLRIFHKFDRQGPKLHGLRHYCRKGSCDCVVCSARGHQ